MIQVFKKLRFWKKKRGSLYIERPLEYYRNNIDVLVRHINERRIVLFDHGLQRNIEAIEVRGTDDNSGVILHYSTSRRENRDGLGPLEMKFAYLMLKVYIDTRLFEISYRK